MPGFFNTPGYNPKALGGVTIRGGDSVRIGVATAAVPAGRFVQSVSVTGESVLSVAGATGTTYVFGVSITAAAAAGNTFEVATLESGHIVEMETGGALTAGAIVTGDASGRAITASVAGHRVLGIVQDSAAGAGEFVKVLLRTDQRTV